MARSRYKIYELTHPHFVTCTILHWLPIFTNQKSAKTLLEQFKFYKKAHKKDREYQIWQEGYQPKLIQTDKIMIKLINYIHQNPVKRGFVDNCEHWRYSSARDYRGSSGLIEIEKFF